MFETTDECALACASLRGCRFFAHGYSDVYYPTAAGRCLWERAATGTDANPCGGTLMGSAVARGATVLEYQADAYVMYELVREELSCSGASPWGQLPAGYYELSSRWDLHGCGAAANCFDGGRTHQDHTTACSQMCMSGNETDPWLLVQFRTPVDLTSVFLYQSLTDPTFMDGGYTVSTAQELYGVDGWVQCANRSVVNPVDQYVHDACRRSGVRALRISAPGPARVLGLLEVEAYGCEQNYTEAVAGPRFPWRGSTAEDTARVDRSSHGFYCGDNADTQACQVPEGTVCVGGVLTDWGDPAATPILSFCGDKGTCLALSSSPVPTSTCVCNPGFEVRFVGRHHVTCAAPEEYPGYRDTLHNATLMHTVVTD